MNLEQSTQESLVGGVMVLYHPDILLLKVVMAAATAQLSHLFVIDNTPDFQVASLNQALINDHFAGVSYTSLGDNYGIASGQNAGISQAIAAGCDHVLLLDQDSLIPVGMVTELLRVEASLLAHSASVGVVGPWYRDKKGDRLAMAITHGKYFVTRNPMPISSKAPIRVDYMIASGSIIRTRVLIEVGLKREDLFIDWVDVEWCLRAARLGFLHYMTPTVMMEHDIGDRVVQVFGRAINLHSDIRNYYIVRNACRLLLNRQIYRRWRINILFKIPMWVILFSVTSKYKLRAFFLLVRACFDGFTGKLGRYDG